MCFRGNKEKQPVQQTTSPLCHHFRFTFPPFFFLQRRVFLPVRSDGLWKKLKMHIFSPCASGSSYCWHPWSNLSVERGTKKVNTCHSVFSKPQWCRVRSSESTRLPVSSGCLAFCEHEYTVCDFVISLPVDMGLWLWALHL